MRDPLNENPLPWKVVADAADVKCEKHAWHNIRLGFMAIVSGVIGILLIAKGCDTRPDCDLYTAAKALSLYTEDNGGYLPPIVFNTSRSRINRNWLQGDRDRWLKLMAVGSTKESFEMGALVLPRVLGNVDGVVTWSLKPGAKNWRLIDPKSAYVYCEKHRVQILLDGTVERY